MKKFKCRCKACIQWKKDSRRNTNRELAKETARQWRLDNLERSRESVKNYARLHPEKVLEWQLNKYDLSTEEYIKMVQKANGKCQICKKPPRGLQYSKKRLCIDHDKNTGLVRGLLCGHCNAGLGLFSHDTKILQSAIKYLEKMGMCIPKARHCNTISTP